MKKFSLSIVFLCLLCSAFCQANKVPFSKGIDLLTFFEIWNENDIPNLNKYEEKDFDSFKSMGIDVIRLPVHFDLLMEPVQNGKIKEYVLEKLDQVCDWAEKNKIYLIIDNHSFNSEEWSNNPVSEKLLKEHLETVWSQVAPRYKDRSEYIMYEIVNEPPYKNSNKWIKIQEELIKLIRTYDTKHSIVVTGADFSSIDTLVKMKPYKDDKLIYTFHFYEPFLFTHQGATWVGKEMMDLEGVPFPYDENRIPEFKGNAKNSWVQDTFFYEYPRTGTVKYINERIKKAADWGKKYKVPVLCGEIGDKVWINREDRLAWINATREALNKNNIPYCTWGIDGSDGFLKTGDSDQAFPKDIDEEVMKAYGFSMPAQEYLDSLNNFTPDHPYLIYDGLRGKLVTSSEWGSINGFTKTDDHGFCTSATYETNNTGINFYIPETVREGFIKNNKNLCIKFSAKFTDVNQEFAVQLVDTDGGSELPPWKKSYLVKAKDYSLNTWVTIEIPVSQTVETGAWSNVDQKSFDPVGKFDWNRLTSISLSFDNFDKKYKNIVYVDDIFVEVK
mgnify:CR=1 FL=1